MTVALIENHIKELKNGFGMEQMPSGDFGANAVYFGIGIMTYNLFLAQKMLTMPEAWQTKTIKSIRWMLVEVGGKLIRGSRRIVMKIAAGIEKYATYLEIRRRTYELMRVMGSVCREKKTGEKNPGRSSVPQRRQESHKKGC